jgi:hypothetical protein
MAVAHDTGTESKFQSAFDDMYRDMLQELRVKYRMDDYEKDLDDLNVIYQKLLDNRSRQKKDRQRFLERHVRECYADCK